ncbi:MAG: outer membrane protein assembly factor BamE [Gammaproteobacteria bacterium]|nr:outer membrane protein assembly factor BamE [Gammaproteobacteria bacterium]
MAHRRSPLHLDAAPTRGLAPARALFAACVGALVVGLVLSGCAYRMDIQQGNIVEQEAIDQVREGMTRSQVQFLLGTPMISDPFHADRWDYPYYFVRGRRGEPRRRWFIVYFENDRVARIEHRIDWNDAGTSDDRRADAENDAEPSIDTAARD